jgi:hypothetical protein
MIKRFKIIADRYRNRRKRFALRFNLIAGVYNLELKTKVTQEIYCNEPTSLPFLRYNSSRYFASSIANSLICEKAFTVNSG